MIVFIPRLRPILTKFVLCFISWQVALWFVVLGLQLLNQAMALISGLAQAQFELKNETAAAADIAQKIDEAHYTLTGLF